MSRVFQYARSTDPEVIAIVQRNWAKRAEAIARQFEWCSKFGAEEYYISGPPPSVDIRALKLHVRPKGFGNWARGAAPDTYRPAKNNPLYKEMQELAFEAEGIPGCPGVLFKSSPYMNASRWGSPLVIAHDGAAWSGIGFAPTEGEFGPQWDEALPSRFLSAQEEFLAAREATGQR